jgi:hypothetical protein
MQITFSMNQALGRIRSEKSKCYEAAALADVSYDIHLKQRRRTRTRPTPPLYHDHAIKMPEMNSQWPALADVRYRTMHFDTVRIGQPQDTMSKY